MRKTTCKCNLLPVIDEHTKIRRLLIDITKRSLLFVIIRRISSIGYQQGDEFHLLGPRRRLHTIINKMTFLLINY